MWQYYDNLTLTTAKVKSFISLLVDIEEGAVAIKMNPVRYSQVALLYLVWFQINAPAPSKNYLDSRMRMRRSIYETISSTVSSMPSTPLSRDR